MIRHKRQRAKQQRTARRQQPAFRPGWIAASFPVATAWKLDLNKSKYGPVDI
jgi:hypothetical protein